MSIITRKVAIMITKVEILSKIDFEELIGTQFEEMMIIKEFKKGSSIYYEKLEKFDTYFIVEGEISHIIHTPEGGKFHRDFFKGDIPGLNFSIALLKEAKCFRLFDINMVAKEDSIIIYLPFEKLIDLEFENKAKILKKLIIIGMEDHFKEYNHLLVKTIYSDKEFFIRYLEENRILNISSSKETSKHLNINLRTLQRLLKDLTDLGIIERIGSKISIKDQSKLDRYKKQFKK